MLTRMGLGMGLGMAPVGSSGEGGYDPTPIVQDGGAWWDLQDTSTLFSDDAATTPAVVGGTVHVVKDKSGNDLHLTQTNDAVAPVLRQRTDGVRYLDFSGGKTMQVADSTARFKYMHDGTGGTFLGFCEWPMSATADTFFRTATSTASIGFWITKIAASEGTTMNVARGVSGQPAVSVSHSRTFLSSALRMLRFSYQSTGTSQAARVAVDTCRDKVNAAQANTPSADASTSNLMIDTAFRGNFYGALIAKTVLADDVVSEVYENLFKAVDYPIPPIDLTFLLGGQSNMSGRGSVTTSEAEAKMVGVYSYTKAEEFRIATIPEHSLENRPVATSPDEIPASAPAHGFMLRAAKAIKTASDKNSLLVPCAIGGTSIAMWDTPATQDDRTTLFGAMKYRYQQAAEKGGDPVIVWYGHEANSGSAVPNYTAGGVGTAYQTDFAKLIADVRANIVDAPLIFVQLASDDTTESLALSLAAAGEAQRQLEQTIPNAFMVVAHDVARNASPDDIHVSRAGVDVIADRVALAVRQHILGEAVNGTGPRMGAVEYSGSTVVLHCDKAINTTAGNFGNLFRVYANGVEQTVSSANRGTDTSTVEIVCAAPLSGVVTLTYGYRTGAVSSARTDFVKDADGLPLPLFGPVVATAV